MKLLLANLLIVFVIGAHGTRAQAQAASANGGLTLDVGATYTVIRANEGPAQCQCFYMSGGTAEFSVKNSHGLAFVTSFGGAHAQNINNLDQNLTVYTVLEGVRYSLNRGGRLSPFGEAAVGFVHTASNYVIYKNTSDAAVQAGGGLDFLVSRRLALRPAQVDYLFTSSPNVQNNLQNEIRFSAGIVYHLHTPDR